MLLFYKDMSIFKSCLYKKILSTKENLFKNVRRVYFVKSCIVGLAKQQNLFKEISLKCLLHRKHIMLNTFNVLKAKSSIKEFSFSKKAFFLY